MIKRIISGLLSAVMSTVLITADFNNARQVDEKTNQNAEKTFLDNGFSVNSTNSLGNYINDAMQQKEQPQKMSNQMSNYNYDVGFAEFDKETKKLNVYSSQSTDVKVSVVFKDEDTAESVYTAEYEAERGENTFNTYDVEVTSLPEFFTVDVMLFDSFNTPVCEPYTITTYTRFIQEMKATDIHDFEEEYVVNLDEDETTNFIVLNENTIKAETTEDTNILVSADYEKDQYVFEHIDETIRYLDKGDHFFIQPTEDDIIALSVGDISIDGDRAILTGDENTEGIFDIIKIDSYADDVSDASVIEDDMPENMSYNGIVEGENGEPALEYSFGESYNYKVKYSDERDMDTTFSFSTDKDRDDEKDFLDRIDIDNPDFSIKELPKSVEMEIDGDAKITGEFRFAANMGFQFYQKWFHVEFDFKFRPEITIEIGAEGSVEVPVSAPPIGFVPFPGLWFGIKPELNFSFECALKYKNTFGTDFRISFDTSREKKLSAINEPFAGPIDELSLEGKIAISLDLQPIIYLISESVVSLKISMPLEVGVECSSNDLTLNRASRTDSSPQTLLLPDDMCYYEDTLHTCKKCFELKPYVSFEMSLVVKILCVPFLDDIKMDLLKIKLVTIDEDDDDDGYIVLKLFEKMYYSFTHDKFGFGECPYLAYETTFNVFDLMYNKDVDVEVSVDGLKTKVDQYYFAHFYCENGTHNYNIFVDGEEIKSGSFIINDAVKEIKISLDEGENISEGEKRKNIEPQKTITVSDFVEELPESSPETIYIESGRLGDSIFYFIYPNGEMHIHGSGEMYDQLPTIVNKSKVKTVYFVDSSPEKNKYITSIGNGLFKDVKNLETVYLSNEITKIGDDAFNGCKSLKYFRYGGEKDTTETFVLPSKLETIGNWAFYDCSSAAIGKLVIGSNTKTIGESAFSGCSTITSVVIPETVTKVEPKVFQRCDKIQTAVIKAKVTDNRMGGGLFYDCKSLEELTVPTFNSFYYYTRWAGEGTKSDDTASFSMYFYNCENKYATHIPSALKKVTVLNGTEIPDEYFSGFNHIVIYALPEGITKIGNSAFYSNDSLSKIICNDKTKDLSFSEMIKDVENIGERAFYSDNGIDLEIGKLVFGNKMKSIGSSAFARCNTITSVVIPENVTKIEPQVFYGCGNIKTAVIKANVDENQMGAGLFYGCDLLEELTVPCFAEFYYFLSSNTWGVDYDRITENVFSMLFYNCSTAYATKIPSSLKKITILNGENMPKNCLDGFELKTLVLPSELKFADSNATQYIKATYEEVIYKGTEEEWANVVIENPNDPLRGPITFSPDEVEEWQTGDANGDGEIDMSDIVLIMQALANPNKYGINGTDPTHITENGFKYGDINGDGLTVNDAVRIQEYLLGKISSLA